MWHLYKNRSMKTKAKSYVDDSTHKYLINDDLVITEKEGATDSRKIR